MFKTINFDLLFVISYKVLSRFMQIAIMCTFFVEKNGLHLTIQAGQTLKDKESLSVFLYLHTLIPLPEPSATKLDNGSDILITALALFGGCFRRCKLRYL
jgi:hypothetical protein